MFKFIVRRILGFIPVILSVAAITFFASKAIPGGPFDFAGDRSLPEEVVKNLEAKYHLDWPGWKQFTSYMIGDELTIFRTKHEIDDVNVFIEGDKAIVNGNVMLLDNKTLCKESGYIVYGGFTIFDLDTEACGTSQGVIRGDLGPSFRYRARTVNDIINETLPLSAQLGLWSILVGLIIGIPAGIVAALHQNTIWDYLATFVAVMGVSIPSMVLGPVLIVIFANNLGWFPVAQWGAKPPYFENMFLTPGFDWINYFSHAILPVLTLGTGISAVFARLTRASMLQIIREDFIRTARAKGLHEQVVIWRHALRNSLIPVVTILGPLAASLVTGTLIVEQIFGLNGLGKHFVQSISNRDYALVLGTTLLFAVLLVISNLFVDIMYAWLDPRIRLE